jgi:hypothetical protein
MPTYRVPVKAEVVVQVTARTEAEAIAKAEAVAEGCIGASINGSYGLVWVVYVGEVGAVEG